MRLHKIQHTPTSVHNGALAKIMNAPEYTIEERKKYFLRHALWAIPIIAVFYFFIIPWYNEFSINAECRSYHGINGAYFVFAMLFSIPIISALVLGLISLKEQLMVIRIAQYPLPNQKVFKPTKYVYGFKAKLTAYIFCVFIALQFAMGVCGIVWSIGYVSENLESYHQKCVN